MSTLPNACGWRDGSLLTRRRALGGLVAGAGCLLSGCGLLWTNSYRFRMTVEVETPQGLRSASSVYEVEGILTTDLMSSGRNSIVRLAGEAVALDLPDGRTLFALLEMVRGYGPDDNIAIMSMEAMDPALIRSEKDKSARRIATGQGIRSLAEVNPKDYPALVIFRDIADPGSIERVDPTTIGVKRILVEATDDPVTTGIERRLSWLKRYRAERRRLNGKTGAISSNDLADILGTSAFSMGVEL